MALTYQTLPVYEKYHHIAGVDEAGRGPWAGPVVAAAVIFPRGYQNELINDSKLLTPAMRERLFAVIQRDAIAIGIGIVAPGEIDRLNILEATKLAMTEALDTLKITPDYIMLDAITLPSLKIKQEALIHGDQLALPIAAASIIAKVTRDRIMIEAQQTYPLFRFDLHKGYGTKLHQAELLAHGPITDFHRFSYKPIKQLHNK